MAKIRGAIVIERDRCKGCNLCVVACPLNLLALAEKEVNKKGYRFAQSTMSATDVHHAPLSVRTDV
mgnify:CR=1 FL=1